MPFLITDTGLIINDGSVVILANFPNIKWIVKHGWYNYLNKQYNGWYFSSIPANNTMPVDESDLTGLTLVSGPGCIPPPPKPCPPTPPGPPGPDPRMMEQLERAWITVDSIEQRDRLNFRLVPNGKVVKVNKDADGKVHYYSYDQSKSLWVDETFGLDDSFVLKSELADDVNNLINNNEKVHQSVADIAKSSINWNVLIN